MMASIGTDKVLIVDDAADNRQMLSELLKDQYTVILAKNGEQALERARQQQPQLILLDVLMPGMSGYEVLSRLQMEPQLAKIPVIFITGLDTPDDIARGLLHGAADYIAKPFNAAIVKARVEAQLRLVRQQRFLEQELAQLDALTGLPARAHCEALLETEVLRSERDGLPLALLLVELQDFSAYRAGHGAAAADRLLQQLAPLLRAALPRPGDLIARWSDTQFLLALPGGDEAGAEDVAARCRQALAQHAIAQEEPATRAALLSLGFGLASGVGVPLSDLLAEAQARLERPL